MFRVDPGALDEKIYKEIIEHAATILREGGLVAFPTETVYGLGANALDSHAVARIYEAKGRPSNNPIILHVATVEAVQSVVSVWPQSAVRLAARFWPGPLTLVLPRAAGIPDIVTGGGPTVGVRVPAHPVALALLLAAGVPIAAPSANLSLQLSPTRASHVLADLDGRIAAVLDGGSTTGGLESTVLNLTTEIPILLRPGLISPAEIETVIGPIQRHYEPMPTPRNAPLPAPGMLSRHYAPRAPLEIAASGSSKRLEALLDSGAVVGWLKREESLPLPFKNRRFMDLARSGNLHLIRMPTDPQEYAAVLYDRLHELDALGVTRILVDALPENEAWLAIRDRLDRAAAKL